MCIYLTCTSLKMFRWTLKALVFQTILFQGTLGNMVYEITHVSLYSIYKKDLIIPACIFYTIYSQHSIKLST